MNIGTEATTNGTEANNIGTEATNLGTEAKNKYIGTEATNIGPGTAATVRGRAPSKESTEYAVWRHH